MELHQGFESIHTVVKQSIVKKLGRNAVFNSGMQSVEEKQVCVGVSRIEPYRDALVVFPA